MVPFRNPIWIPPDPGCYKINCDAAINVAERLVGFGIVIRNSEGLVMASSSQKLEATFSPQVGEVESIHRGLARDSGLVPCRIDSDAEVVVGWITSQVCLCSDVGSIISDICVLLKYMHCNSVNFDPRKANQIAHVLAKNGLSCVEDMFWLEDFPPCVSTFVVADRRGCL